MGGPVSHIEVRHRVAGTDGPYRYQTFPPDATSVVLTGVDRAVEYEIQARSVGPTRLVSVWVDISHTVAGYPTPNAPSSLAATAVTDGVALSWVVATANTPDVAYDIERAPDVAGSPGTYALVAKTRTTNYVVPCTGTGAFWFRVRSRNYRDVLSSYSNAVSADPVTGAEISADIADALTAANNAQATADGAVVSFWQNTPPTIGSGPGEASVGDIWFDTDDGNKIYRVVGSSWVDAQDDDLALALAAASNAQATADGKVKTYFASTAPVDSPVGTLVVGDLWFNTTTKKLFRWNGSNWSDNIGDITLAQLGGNGTNVLWDEYSVYDFTSLPGFQGPVTGTLSRSTTTPFSNTLASLQIVRTAAGSDNFYFSNNPATASNRNILLGGTKKYILSLYVYSSVANPALSFYLSDGTTDYGGSVDVSGVSANNWIRVALLVDASASSSVGLSWKMLLGANTASQTLRFSKLMVEPSVGDVTTPSTWSPGAAGPRALVALNNAAAAQSTADGKIDSFFQNTAPSGSGYGVGDLWFDTDDGNKQYNWNGSSWVLSADTRIGTAITAAAGAQATADGKVKTFFQASTSVPTATSLGDLWVQTDTFYVLRWSGSAWAVVGGTLNTTTVQNGVVLPYGFGDELVANGSFESNVSGTRNTTINEYVAGINVCDGWQVRYNGGVGMALGLTTANPDTGTYSLQIGVSTARSIAAATELRSDVRMIQRIPVKANERFLFSAYIKWAQTIAVPAGLTAAAAVYIIWENSAGGTISSVTLDGAYNTTKRLSKAITAPALAVNAEVFCLVSLYNSTGGAISSGNYPVQAFFDSISLKRLSFTSDNPNLLKNSDFTNGNADWSGSPTIFKATEEGYQGRSGALTSGTSAFYFQSVPLSPAAGENMTFAFDAYFVGTTDANSLIGCYMEFLDVAGTTILYTSPIDYLTPGNITGNYKRLVTSGPSPGSVGYVRCVVWMRGAFTGGLGIFRRPKLERGPVDTSYTAGIEVVYGQEITLPGSGRRIGDQRNLLPVGVGSLISRVDGLTPTYTFTTATPAVVTINLTACTLRIGSTSVSYASSSANVNQTRNTTVVYFAYYLDLTYAGGTKTLNLTTDPNTLVNSDDVVYIASFSVFVPAAATGGGGGGDPCPEIDELVPHWDGHVTTAQEVRSGDYLTVIDSGTLLTRPGRVTYSETREAQIWVVETDAGVLLRCSDSAPIPTRHGLVLAPLCLGHETVVSVHGIVRWANIVAVYECGHGLVQHITCEDDCFLVGHTAGCYLSHHNAKQEPP